MPDPHHRLFLISDSMGLEKATVECWESSIPAPSYKIHLIINLNPMSLAIQQPCDQHNYKVTLTSGTTCAIIPYSFQMD